MFWALNNSSFRARPRASKGSEGSAKFSCERAAERLLTRWKTLALADMTWMADTAGANMNICNDYACSECKDMQSSWNKIAWQVCAHTHICTYLVNTHLQTMHMGINGTWHSKQSVVTGETIYNLGVRLHTPWYEFHLDDILQRCNNRSLIPKRCVWLCLQIIMTCHGVLRCVRAVEVGILHGNGFKDSGWWFDSRTRRILIVVSPSRFALHPFALGGWGSLWKWFAREVASKSMPQSTSVDAQ